MELIKRASPTFKFSDGSEATFEIESIGKADRRAILEKCRNGNALDMERYNPLVIKQAVKGWSGLRNRHLLTVYDVTDKGDRWQFKGDMKPETEIEFSEEALLELAEMGSIAFMTFINLSLNRIDAENIKAKEAELKN